MPQKEKELKDYCLKNNYKITSLCQENAWVDTEILEIQLNKIFFNNKIDKNKIQKILILNGVTNHYQNNMIEKFKKYNSVFILILPSFTRFIQPLNVSGPFKKALHHWNINYRIRNLKQKKPNSYDVTDAGNHLL